MRVVLGGALLCVVVLFWCVLQCCLVGFVRCSLFGLDCFVVVGWLEFAIRCALLWCELTVM